MAELHQDTASRFTLILDDPVTIMNLWSKLDRWVNSDRYGFCEYMTCDLIGLNGGITEGTLAIDVLPDHAYEDDTDADA